MENISKVFFFFCLFCYKKNPLKVGRVTSDSVRPPLTVTVSGFTHNPVFLAVSEFKMTCEAELVDLAETEGASSNTERDEEVLTLLDV